MEFDALKISLNNLIDVQSFVNTAMKCTGLVTVYSSIYCVDGKGLLGILSLDLSHHLTVELEDKRDVEKFKKFCIQE